MTRCRSGTIALLACAVALAGCGRDASAERLPSHSLVVGHVAPSTPAGASARRGAELGAEEAARTGALLGRSFVLRTARAEGSEDEVTAATRLIDDGAMAIVGGFDEKSCALLAELARERGVLFMNVGCRGDALRATSVPGTFHVEASDSMYLAGLLAMRATGGAAPVLWHGALERYGAAQLNQRFARRFGTAADASAWASWMAMKAIWQAALDGGATAPLRLAEQLASAEAEFDGHKGEPLRFDAATRQLRQPLHAPPLDEGTGSGRLVVEGTPGAATRIEREALRRAAAAGEPLLVVTNEGSGEVAILHAGRGEVLATIPFAERPRGVQVGKDGRRAWVALSDESPTHAGDGDAIVELDLVAGRLAARHAAGSDPEQFAVNAEGTLLVAANEDAGTATLLDLRTGATLATLLVGIEPEGVAMSPDGRWVYVTAETSNTVSVIDTRLREVVASFLVDERPRGAAFAPDGRRAYVTNEISGTLSIIDVERHAVVGTLSLAGGRARPVGVVVSPDGHTVYVANGRANSVSFIDARTVRETHVVDVGRRPWGVALSRDGRRLYVANGGSNDVSVVETASAGVVATIPAGERPWGVGVTR